MKVLIGTTFPTRMVGISLTGLLDKVIKNGDNHLKLSNTDVKLKLLSRSLILAKLSCLASLIAVTPLTSNFDS